MRRRAMPRRNRSLRSRRRPMTKPWPPPRPRTTPEALALFGRLAVDLYLAQDEVGASCRSKPHEPSGGGLERDDPRFGLAELLGPFRDLLVGRTVVGKLEQERDGLIEAAVTATVRFHAGDPKRGTEIDRQPRGVLFLAMEP